MKREPLEVERLIRDDQRVDDHTRRVSVAEHERFRADLAASLAAQQPDPIDDALGDPAVELHARRRKNSEAARTLAILDEIERSRN
jgi:hypothetical protein